MSAMPLILGNVWADSLVDKRVAEADGIFFS